MTKNLYLFVMKTLIKSRPGATLFLALAFTSLSLNVYGNQLFTHGLGSQSFPYLIENAGDLLLLAQLVNEGNTEYNNRYIHYRLEANINLSAYGSGYNGGKGWIPVGYSDAHPFFANFDGNNKTVSNLYISNSAQGAGGYGHTGLFGWLNGGAVKRLIISSATITGSGNVGGIAGSVSFSSETGRSGDISNCIFSGTVSGGSRVGGITGANTDGRIINCYAMGSVSGADYAGGVAGHSYAGAIRNCAALNQSVSASVAGGNVARVAWAQPGAVATMLSGNIAFDKMSVLSNGAPKTIVSSAGGVDGAGRSAVDLRYISGFPSGFNVSPWVFAPGKLPGLGSSLNKPDYLTAMLVTLAVNRNGEAWIRSDKTYTLKFSGNESISCPMTRTPNSNLFTTAVSRSGVWNIYDDETFTGSTITVDQLEGSGVISYFTVSYSVRDAGAISGSAISATYGGKNITSGDLVIGGKTLVITTTNSGGQTCAYAWIGAGTSGQTTASISTPFLENSVNAFCTVTSIHAVTFDVVSANGMLTATVDDIPISPGEYVLYGKNVVFRAAANPGYSVEEWKHNGVTVNSVFLTYTIYNLAATLDVTVEYKYAEYEVNFGVEGANGALFAMVDGTGISAGIMIEKDKNIEFAAAPVSGYRVKEWKVNGYAVPGVWSADYSLYLTEPTTVTVVFEADINVITFGVTEGNGEITATADGLRIYHGNEIPKGRDVVFTAGPAANYRVKEWKDNGITVNGADETYELRQLDYSHFVTVAFELVTYEVVFGVTGGNGALGAKADGIDIKPGAQIQHGKSIVFTATPNPGLKVKEWKNNGIVVNDAHPTYTVSDLEEAINITVEYEYKTYELEFYPENGENGSLTASTGEKNLTSVALVQHGADIEFSANPATGYRVKYWTLNGTTIPGHVAINYQLKKTDADAKVTVAFEMVTYKVTFSNPDGNGTLVADGTDVTGEIQVQHGKTLVFTATPNENYRIKEWKVNTRTVNGTYPTYTLSNITEAYDVTVAFEPVTYAVVFSVAGGNGSIAATVDGVPVSSGTQVPHGKPVIFTVTPNTNYSVREWKVGDDVISGNQTNTYTLPGVSAPVTVTAELAPVVHTILFSADGNGTLSATVNGSPVVDGEAVQQGRNVVFTARPAPEYRVKKWMNGTTEVPDNATNSYTHPVTGPATITVEFERDEFVISFNVTGTVTGDISATIVDGDPITSGDPVLRGKSVVFTATPAGCNDIKEWRMDGSVVNDSHSGYLITGVASSHSITVAFGDISCIPVTFGVEDGNGTLTARVDGLPVTSVANVPPGKNVVFTATPATDNRVKAWYLNGELIPDYTSNIYPLTSLSASTVTVVFENLPPTHHTVSFSILNGIGGTIKATVAGVEITSPESVEVGEEIVFTLTPASGYSLKECKDNGNQVSITESIFTISDLSSPHDITAEFVINTYTVDFGASGNVGGKVNATAEGSVIASGSAVQHGKKVLFAAVADEGYQLKEWWLDGKLMDDKSDNYEITALSDAASVTAVFEKITFLLTFHVTGADYGSLVVTVDSTPVSSGETIEHGKTVTFTATPQSDYCRVKEWTDNDEAVNGSKTTYTITGYASEHTITIEFEPVTFPVRFGDGITVTANGAVISSGDRVQQGSMMTFTALPAEGYVIKEWIVNGASYKNDAFPITHLMEELTVAVEFEEITYLMMIGKAGNGTLTATVDGIGIRSGDRVQHGKEIIFVASPASGYRVKEWRHNGAEVSGDTPNRYVLSDLSADATVTAEFEQIILTLRYDVDGGNGTLKATVNGVDIGSDDWAGYGESVVFTATPASGYRIKEWKDNETTVNGDHSIYTIHDFTSAHTVSVTFEPVMYAVTFHPMNGYGTLTATVDGESISSGEMIQQGKEVIFTATPEANCRIKGWKVDGVTGTVAGDTYRIDYLGKDHIVTVDFELISFSVSFSIVNGNGLFTATVDGSGISSGALVQQGKEIVFRAIPLSGYNVKEWTVNGSAEPNFIANRFTLSDLSDEVLVLVEFELTNLSLMYDIVGGNGVLSVTADGTDIASNTSVDYGKSVVFLATPNTGYRIKEWKDNGDTVNGTYNKFTIPNFTREHIVTVEFEAISFPVTFHAVNGNGTLAATVDGIDVISVAQVLQGGSVEFTAIPNNGYRVKEWRLNGEVVSGNKTNSYTSPDVTALMSVTVEFELAIYTVTFNVVKGNGLLFATVGGMVDITSGTQVPHGRNIVFTASPDNDYRVKEWRLNDVKLPGDVTNSYSMILTDVTAMTVEFELIPVTIVTTGLPDGVVETEYNQILSAISDLSVKWELADGSLPEGLFLSEDGRISGMPATGGTFTFTVKATNSAGNDTKTLLITVEKCVGAAVAIPEMQSKTLNSITLTDVAEPGNGQTVEYALSRIKNAGPASLSWQDETTFSDLTAYTTYFVYARSKENDGYLAGAVSVSVAIETGEEINSVEILPATIARAYPNPTTGLFILEFEVAGVYHVTITDMSGKKLSRRLVVGTINQLDISNYPSGVYLIVIDDGKQQSAIKIWLRL